MGRGGHSKGREQPSEERVSGEGGGLAPPASPSLASCPSPHRESPCPTGPQPPSWSYANTLLVFYPPLPERAVGGAWSFHLPSLSVGLLPLPAGTPQLPVPRLTRSRPEAEAPEIGLAEPEARSLSFQGSLSSGLRAPSSTGKGKGRWRKGGGIQGGRDQWGSQVCVH